MVIFEEIAYLYKDEAYFKLLRMSKRKDITAEDDDYVHEELLCHKEVYKNFFIYQFKHDSSFLVSFREPKNYYTETLFESSCNRTISEIKLIIDLCLHINLPKIVVYTINVDGSNIVDKNGKTLCDLRPYGQYGRFIRLTDNSCLIGKYYAYYRFQDNKFNIRKSNLYHKAKNIWYTLPDELLIKAHNMFLSGGYQESYRFIKTLTYDRITKKELKQVKELTNDSFMENLSKIRPLVYNQIKESSFDFSNLELLIAFCCDIKAIEYFNKHKKNDKQNTF